MYRVVPLQYSISFNVEWFEYKIPLIWLVKQQVLIWPVQQHWGLTHCFTVCTTAFYSVCVILDQYVSVFTSELRMRNRAGK